MSLCKVIGIVVHCANYREYDKIIHIFTIEKGLITACARGCRKPTSKLVAAVQPFVCGEYVLFESNGKYTIDSCDIKETFYHLREEMSTYAAGMYILSLINGGTQNYYVFNRMLFDLLYYSLSYIAYGENCSPRDIAIAFLVKMIDILGYTPSITKCLHCGRSLLADTTIYFNAQRNGAICKQCKCIGSVQVKPITLEAIRRIIKLDIKDIIKVKMPEYVSKEVLDIMNSYAEIIFETKFIPHRLFE